MSKKHLSKSKTPNHITTINWEFLTLILCTLLALGGLIHEFYFSFKPTAKTNQADTSVKKVIQPNAFFYTEVLLDRKKTYLTFPFRFEKEPLTMRLSLLTKVNHPPIERLIMHPLLYSLDWKTLTTKDLTLYERSERYTSVDSFLQNPPAEAMVLFDPTAANLIPGKFSHSPTLTDNQTTIDNSINYILTTYKPVTGTNGWFAYEAELNTETAEENVHHELVWQLQVPLASEQAPYYLGEVHVDFRQ